MLLVLSTMKSHAKSFVVLGLIASAFGSDEPSQPEVTVTRATNILVRRLDPGDIGIKPPPTDRVRGSVGPFTGYLRVQDPNHPFYPYQWIGENPDYIRVTKTTSTNKASKTKEAEITKGVSAEKNKGGGLDVLLSPKVLEKLKGIAKDVKPCAAKRGLRFVKRGPACGLADFVDRVGADQELRGTFSEQFTDQVWAEIDEGYSGEPSDNGGWEGDGGEPFDDEGYFSDDADGFFEGSEAGEAEGTLETVVFASEAEAAAVAEAAGLVETGAVFGAATVTTGSFLAMIWNSISSGKDVPPVYQVPKESIHKITKSKTKTDDTSSTKTTTTSADSCPTGLPDCGDDCAPTSAKRKDPKATGIVDWKCSKGKDKDCKCNPKVNDISESFNFQDVKTIWETLDKLDKAEEEPRIECEPPLSDAPSQWFGDITKNFCPDAMKMEHGYGPVAYDVDGNKIPLLKARSPPEHKSNYKDYKFFVEYKPKDEKCLMDKKDICEKAYERLVKSNCGSNHGSAGNRLYVNAKIDVGCGVFSWKVEKPKPAPPPPPPALGDIDCHDHQKKHDVHDGAQEVWSKYGCEDKTMKPGDKEIYWSIPGAFGDWYQEYKITWAKDCDRFKEQNIDKPLSDNDITCATIMRDNYKKCTANGGAGGTRQAGCLIYDFYVHS